MNIWLNRRTASPETDSIMDNGATLKNLLDGDNETWVRFVELLVPALRETFARLIDDREQQEEAAQEILTGVVRAMARTRSVGAVMSHKLAQGDERTWLKMLNPGTPSIQQTLTRLTNNPWKRRQVRQKIQHTIIRAFGMLAQAEREGASQ